LNNYDKYNLHHHRQEPTRIERHNLIFVFLVNYVMLWQQISCLYSHSHSINTDCSQYQSHGNWRKQCYYNYLFLVI